MAQPQVKYTREVRFAVVMYGGVSLAIYMNGIAQELLRLVRSTASTIPKHPGADRELLLRDLDSTDAIYREIAQILGREADDKHSLDAPIRTRFVIDILSGTSAGGINAIFLGKALAEGLDIADTARLWVEEGDIGKLINDRDSVGGVDIPRRTPPPSLLNGDRFYRKLYDAFVAMGQGKTSGPLVDKLDLFVTATDLRGLPVALRLADTEVWESKHRHVFTFRYEDGGSDDFGAPYDPMLAFAARCTSSFPFAFEPACFGDIAALLPGPAGGAVEELPEEWRRFFPEFCESAEGQEPSPGARRLRSNDPAARAFGDGGYLDNKPFGYAIDALPTHSNERPVERKLLYIEPSPEHPEDARVCSERPDALEATLGAFTLPRKETIREDLNRVLERNRLIERVDRFLDYMAGDVQHVSGDRLPRYEDDRDLRQRLDLIGMSYLSYHRLKVTDLSDEIALGFARGAGYSPGSAAYQEVRSLVSGWRETRFVRPGREAPSDARKRQETEFLMEYTLTYRIRRLRYVIRIADKLCLDEDFLLDTVDSLRRNPRLASSPHLDLRDRGFVLELLPALAEGGYARRVFRDELRRVRGLLDGVLRSLYATSGELDREAAKAHAEILSRDLERQRAWLDAYIEGSRRPHVMSAASRARATSEEVLGKFDVAKDPLPQQPAEAARWLLWRYYANYEMYDMVSYPMLYATDAGVETAPIAVHRISPEDATALVDERAECFSKLAGDSLGHFGAFLDEGFRRNDVLWGRLDGAERLISILLADGRYQQDRVRLIRQAHETILAEELGALDAAMLTDYLLASAQQGRPTVGPDEPGSDKPVSAAVIAAAIRSVQEPAELRNAFIKKYAPPTEVDPHLAIRSLARTSAVVGQMLEDIGNRRARNGGALGAWVARLGRWFLLLVDAAVPGSLPYHFFRHWRGLLYIFEGMLFVVGLIFAPDVARLGAVLLVITGAVHIVWFLVGDYLRKRDGVLRALQRIGVLVAVALSAVGAWTVWDRVLAPLFEQLGW